MKSFLEEVIEEVQLKYGSLEEIIFVLPSKRAGTFLRNSIGKTAIKTAFAPEIYSIETFIEKIANLGYANNTEQLFHLYESYLKTTQGEPENFYAFSKWGQTLLQDFNDASIEFSTAASVANSFAMPASMSQRSPVS